MKKLFTLMALALTCVANMNAQVKVTCDGKEVSTNHVLTFNAVYDEDEGSAVAGPALDPTFTNTSDESIDLLVTTKISPENANGMVFSWCGLTGNCAFMNRSVETRQVTLAPGASTTMVLHAYFGEGAYKTVNANVFVSADGENVTNFVEKFVYAEPSAISQVKADNKGISVNGTTLNYAFGSAAHRAISLYGTDGRLVKRINTTSATGSVSLSGLQRGLYLATTGMGGSVKVMVK